MADSGEESSWTFYIQGFMCDDNNNNNNNDCDDNSESESPSLVSDAASSAVLKKKTFTNNQCLRFSSEAAKTDVLIPTNNQISFKKHKVISAMDFDLEDTASSPVNSPKVSYMNQFTNQKEKGKMDDISEVKRNNSGKGGVFAVERDTNCTDLKKRTCG